MSMLLEVYLGFLENDSQFTQEQEKWIQKAVQHPGGLHKALGVKKGEKIPAKKLAVKPGDSKKVKKMKVLAKTLKKIAKKKK